MRDILIGLTAIILYVSIMSFVDDNGFTSFADDPLATTRGTVVIHSEFVPKEHIQMHYLQTGSNKKNVLAFSQMINEKECVIHSVKPEGWDDHRSLAMLGHEMLHCLGGQHK